MSILKNVFACSLKWSWRSFRKRVRSQVKLKLLQWLIFPMGILVAPKNTTCGLCLFLYCFCFKASLLLDNLNSYLNTTRDHIFEQNHNLWNEQWLNNLWTFVTQDTPGQESFTFLAFKFQIVISNWQAHLYVDEL